MSPNAYIVESQTRRALAAESQAATISTEALAWVNARTLDAIRQCAATGRRTPSGRLMAPPDAKAAPGPVTIQTPEQTPTADCQARAERVCWRAKEWRAMSSEEKTRHIMRVYGAAASVYEPAMDLLIEISAAGIGPHAARAREIVAAAAELLP